MVVYLGPKGRLPNWKMWEDFCQHRLGYVVEQGKKLSLHELKVLGFEAAHRELMHDVESSDVWQIPTYT